MASTAPASALPAPEIPPPDTSPGLTTDTANTLKLLDRFASRGSTPTLEQIDHELHVYAYHRLHRQAAADAQWACHVLAGAIDRARTADQAPRLDDMHLGRTLAERSTRTYAVLAAMTTHGVYTQLANEWNHITNAIDMLIATCLDERARELVRDRRATLDAERQESEAEHDVERERTADTYAVASHLAEAHRLGTLSNRIAHVVIHSPLTSQSALGL